MGEVDGSFSIELDIDVYPLYKSMHARCCHLKKSTELMYSFLSQLNIGMLGTQEPSSGDDQCLTVSKNFQKREENKGAKEKQLTCGSLS